MNKIRHGQFYTVGNPFVHSEFMKFLSEATRGSLDAVLTEPFAGANNIVKLVNTASGNNYQWQCYDLEPESQSTNVAPQYPVEKRDTLLDYPSGSDIVITNPPYLAKNSATRKKMQVDFGPYDDLYQVSLDVMLDKSSYVAAIIPESFITSKHLKDRCSTIISLPEPMFDDTEHPVCLALFTPAHVESPVVYSGSKRLGSIAELRTKTNVVFTENSPYTLKFNDPSGELGFHGVDNTRNNSIRFGDGNEIDPQSIKVSSRAISRISIHLNGERVNLSEDDVLRLSSEANNLIEQYRSLSQDVFLTSFKGLRKDGKYRRRLDYKTAAQVLRTVIPKVQQG